LLSTRWPVSGACGGDDDDDEEEDGVGADVSEDDRWAELDTALLDTEDDDGELERADDDTGLLEIELDNTEDECTELLTGDDDAELDRAAGADVGRLDESAELLRGEEESAELECGDDEKELDAADDDKRRPEEDEDEDDDVIPYLMPRVTPAAISAETSTAPTTQRMVAASDIAATGAALFRGTYLDFIPVVLLLLG
jgi:hypothetical protein